MRVLVSVPGEKVQHAWPDLIVDGSLVKELLSDESLIETFDRLAAYLDSLGIGTKFILRPEILGVEHAKSYLRERVPDLCGHIHIGSPHRFKYLKGCTNCFCASPVRGADEVKTICQEFAFNPRRLCNVSALLNGFWLARLISAASGLHRPLWLPGRIVLDGGIAKCGSKKIPTDLPVTSLFLNRKDAQDSARVMMSKSSSLGAYVSSRESNRSDNVFLAILDARDEWPTALGAVFSDLAILAAKGARFTCLVLLVGAPSLDVSVLEAVSRRLNSSLDLGGVRKGLLQSDSIVLTVVDVLHLRSLFEYGDSVFLVDPNWSESEASQLAVLAGLRPIFLDSLHPSLLEAFRNSAVTLSSRPMQTKSQTDIAMSFFNRPGAGAIRSCLESAGSERLSQKRRIQNARIARAALDRSTKQFKRALGLDAEERTK